MLAVSIFFMTRHADAFTYKRALGTVAWVSWGVLWAFAFWVYLWAVGTWRLEWRDGLALVPILMAASVSALTLGRFLPRPWKVGIAMLVVAIWLIPAVDLLLRPGCANVESIELYRTEAGEIDTRCRQTADMTREGLTAIAGLVGASALLGLLVRRRKAARHEQATADVPEE